MKIRNMTTIGICASLILGGTIAGTSIANAQGAGTTGGTPPPVGKVGGKKNKEKHPEMKMALRKLEAAKTDLQKAAHDFGGHRVKAVEATDLAIAEIREALKFDK